MKAGIIHADQLSTVSPQYAKEIRTKEFGCGLEGVMRKSHGAVAGILNGIDHDIWDPEKDRFIDQTYSRSKYSRAKAKNKICLQKEMGLDVSEDKPLLAFVGRLSHQKGIDLIISVAEKIIAMGFQLVFLGQGDNGHEEGLKGLASKFPGRVAANNEFNEHLGHQIYAGSDFFLMPSRFEPCGLSQMISLAYGSIPIVYRTGGLADTVKPYGPWDQNGNGIVFKKYTAQNLLNAVKYAMEIFRDQDRFDHIRRNAFKTDFSWERSAQKYKELYQCASSD